MLASPGLIPGGVIPPTLQHTSPFIAPGQAAPAPQAPQAPATAVNPALPLQPAPPSNQLDVTANHASSISKTKTAAAAAINWGRVLSGFGGGVAGGGLAYNNAIQSGLSPTEAILPTTIGTLSGGMSGTGIHKARQEGSTLPQAFGKAKVPVMTTLANDMYGAPLWANLKGNILEQKDRLTGTPTADLMKYLGGGALTIAGLAALFQATRAAKRVGDGEPLVNASSTVFAGGSGGPDNPNVGGKVRVMLPTRNPGDNETEVELPLENVPLSGAVLHNIRRDVRRRLRAEGSSRTIPRGSGTSVKTLMAV
jgi:hypothetical protein